MKIWQKNTQVNEGIEAFTIGNDRELDLQMAAFDILGSLAHVEMLASINLLTAEELAEIKTALKVIFQEIEAGKFTIDDNVLVDLKLYFRSCIQEIVANTTTLFDQLIDLSNTHQDKLLPGYTHLQIAMPSSFGLWFGAYAESLTDDMEVMLAAYKVCNKNPLGSAAGYGSSFPLNRTLTTELLGFEKLNYNVVYAQMGRGRCYFSKNVYGCLSVYQSEF